MPYARFTPRNQREGVTGGTQPGQGTQLPVRTLSRQGSCEVTSQSWVAAMRVGGVCVHADASPTMMSAIPTQRDIDDHPRKSCTQM
jgi:hypothetical protein